MNYHAPVAYKTRWSTIKQRDILRQRAILKQSTAKKTAGQDAYMLVLPKGLNAACVFVASSGTVYTYIYDSVGGYEFSVRSAWLLSIRYYGDTRTLCIKYSGRYPFNGLV